MPRHADFIYPHDIQGEQVHSRRLSGEQGENARENDADGRRCVPVADHLFRAKSDQLRAGNGGKGAAGFGTAPHPLSSGVCQQLPESIHLRSEQQELPPWVPKDLHVFILLR